MLIGTARRALRVVFASRTLPSAPVTFGFSLMKTESGTTTDSQAQKGFQLDSFGSTWNNGTFSSPTSPLHPAAMLASGKLDSGTQMGTFGDVTMTIHKAGALFHGRSCGGKIDTFRRKVTLTGAFDASPDAPTATPYFGQVSEKTLSGVLVLTINRKGGKPCKPRKAICPTGVALQYFDASNPTVIPSWAAGALTIGGQTTYVFEGVVLDQSNPSIFAFRIAYVGTMDSTWFTSVPDLTSAHADTSVLNAPFVTGTTDYAYNGTAATSQPATCGGATYTDSNTNGTLSAPVSFTLDGAGTFGNVASASGSLGSTTGPASGARSAAVRAALRAAGPSRIFVARTLHAVRG